MRVSPPSGAVTRSSRRTATDSQLMDFDTLKEVLAALERHGVRYVIFGAAALNVHGLARFTEVLDLFIAPDRDNVEHLKEALRTVFADPHIDEISSDDLQGAYPALQSILVSVATPATLYRMKRDTVRPKDRADAAWLKERFGLEDE